MTGGWLANVIMDPYINVFGVLQILGKQVKPMGDNWLTLLKVSDGKLVTWQATGTPTALEKLDEIGNCLIEVTSATLCNGYRLIIENFEVVSREMNEEVVLEEELEFLDKKFYEEIFKNKGMMNNVG